MPTTLNTSAAADISAFEGLGYGVVCKPVTLVVSAYPTAGTSVGMLKIPAGAIVFDLFALASDMDTNGTPTMSFSVGTDASPSYFLNTSVIPQTGGAARPAGTARPLTFANADTINITWNAAAASFAAGTIDLSVLYVNP